MRYTRYSYNAQTLHVGNVYIFYTFIQKSVGLPGLRCGRAVCSPASLRLGRRRDVRSAAALQLKSLVCPVMSALVVCVERVPSPTIFGRRTVVSSSSAAAAGCISGRVHFVSLTSELAKPASKRTGTASTADADIWILSGNQSKRALLESESIYNMLYSSSTEENRCKSFLKSKINKQIFIFFVG